MGKLSIFVAAALALFAAVAHGQAATCTNALDGGNTMAAEADNFMYPNGKWGDNDSIQMSGQSGYPKKRTLIRFPTPTCAGTVTKATLRLYWHQTAGTGYATHTISAHQLLQAFDEDISESSINAAKGTKWAVEWGQPGTDWMTQPAGLPLILEDDGITDKVRAYYEWDVTLAVQGWVTMPATNFGLIIYSDKEVTEGRDLRWSSIENRVNSPPQLVLETTGGTTAPPTNTKCFDRKQCAQNEACVRGGCKALCTLEDMCIDKCCSVGDECSAKGNCVRKKGVLPISVDFTHGISLSECCALGGFFFSTDPFFHETLDPLDTLCARDAPQQDIPGYRPWTCATAENSCEKWSRWYDRDNPSGTGDWEDLTSLRREHRDTCLENPSAIQVEQTNGVGTPEDAVFFKNDVISGFVCRNADQMSGRCLDYRARFCCDKPAAPAPTCSAESKCARLGGKCAAYCPANSKCYDDLCSDPEGLDGGCTCAILDGDLVDPRPVYVAPTCDSWTNWMNRDRPSGTGDWETLNDFNKQLSVKVCDGNVPTGIDARLKTDMSPAVLTNDVFSHHSPEVGLVCVNKEQKDGTCLDYTVRFCCDEQPATTCSAFTDEASCSSSRCPLSAERDCAWNGAACGCPTVMQPTCSASNECEANGGSCAAVCADGFECVDEWCSGSDCTCAIKNYPWSGTCGSWTKWFDRDNPSGSGDWEGISSQNKQTPGAICEKPTAIQAVDGNGKMANASVVNFLHYDTTYGLVCKNSMNEGMCPDFKVRYCCDADPDPSPPTCSRHTSQAACSESPCPTNPKNACSWDDKGNTCDCPRADSAPADKCGLTSGSCKARKGECVPFCPKGSTCDDSLCAGGACTCAMPKGVCFSKDDACGVQGGKCVDYCPRGHKCDASLCGGNVLDAKFVGKTGAEAKLLESIFTRSCTCATPIGKPCDVAVTFDPTSPAPQFAGEDKVIADISGICNKVISKQECKDNINCKPLAFQACDALGNCLRSCDEFKDCSEVLTITPPPTPTVKTCAAWTNWLDRDNPGGTGDWEDITNAQKKYGVCDGGTPVAIEARVVGSHVPADQTGEVFYGYAAKKGFVCRNKDQPDGRCLDYEARFCCDDLADPTVVDVSCGQFTDKLSCSANVCPNDRSHQCAWGLTHTGTEACGCPHEVTTGNDPCEESTKTCFAMGGTCAGDVCPDGHDCIKDICTGDDRCGQLCAIPATDAGTCADYNGTPDLCAAATCPEDEGRACVYNTAAGTCGCTETEVKDCKAWTRFFDRDNPSGTGDWESLGSLRKQYPGQICEKPSGIEAMTQDGRLAKEGVTDAKFKYYDTERGFVCVNADPGNKFCKDYKVRFCCDDEEVNEEEPRTCADHTDGAACAAQTCPKNPRFKCDWDGAKCDCPTTVDVATCSDDEGSKCGRVGGTCGFECDDEGFACFPELCGDTGSCVCAVPKPPAPTPAPTVVAKCDGDQWTNWLDRDNPGGTGDWEDITNAQKKYGVCKHPSLLQVRDKSTGKPASSTGEVFFKNSAAAGFVCRNSDQPDRFCRDYEVRFCCGANTSGNVVTTPTAAPTVSSCTDYTALGEDKCIRNECPADSSSMCVWAAGACGCPQGGTGSGSGSSSDVCPASDMCAVKGGTCTSYCPVGHDCHDELCDATLGSVHVNAKLDRRPVLNHLFPPRKSSSCTCAVPQKPNTCNEWSQWMDRDNPSGNGDYEDINGLRQRYKFCANPSGIQVETLDGVPASNTPLAFRYVDTTRGFACVNRDNEEQCLDYRVRFCCDEDTPQSCSQYTDSDSCSSNQCPNSPGDGCSWNSDANGGGTCGCKSSTLEPVCQADQRSCAAKNGRCIAGMTVQSCPDGHVCDSSLCSSDGACTCAYDDAATAGVDCNLIATQDKCVANQCQLDTDKACVWDAKSGCGCPAPQASASIANPPGSDVECAGGRWTQWFNRDHPSGSGDWEGISSQNKKTPNSIICENPAAVQAVTRSGKPAESTGEVFFKYDTVYGFVCRNADQPDRVCQDYHVRYCCAPTVPASCSQLSVEVCAAATCPNDRTKNCVVKGDKCGCPQTAILQPSCDAQVAEKCTASGGKCMNACPEDSDCVSNLCGSGDACTCAVPKKEASTCGDFNGSPKLCASSACPSSPGQSCQYFSTEGICGCPADVSDCAGQWTAWMDRDNPSGDGDWEHLSALKKERGVCDAPNAIEARTTSGLPASLSGETFERYSADQGFACRNEQQADGFCLDYQVRFCCPNPDTSTVTGVVSPLLLTGCAQFNKGGQRECEAQGCPTSRNSKCKWDPVKQCTCDKPVVTIPTCSASLGCARVGGECLNYCPGEDFSCFEDLCGEGAGCTCAVKGAAPTPPPSVEPTPAVKSCSELSYKECLSNKCPLDETRDCVYDKASASCGCPTGTASSEPTCDNGGVWTSWFDRDNPSGTGDWEDLGSLRKQNTICDSPSALHVTTKTGGSLASADEVYYRNDASAGFVCRNQDQADGFCEDYKVRFCCGDSKPKECADFTSLGAAACQRNECPADPNNMCVYVDDKVGCTCASNVATPTPIAQPTPPPTPTVGPTSGTCGTTSSACEEAGGKCMSYCPDEDSDCDAQLCNQSSDPKGDNSFAALVKRENADTRTRQCFCVKPTESCKVWTRFFDRDNPSGSGDWEDLNSLRTSYKICEAPSAMEVLAMDGNAASSTGEVFFRNDASTGFVCRNKDQEDGRCMDYKVRFCCDEKPLIKTCSDIADRQTCVGNTCPTQPGAGCMWSNNKCGCPSLDTPVCADEGGACRASKGKCVDSCPESFDCNDSMCGGCTCATPKAPESPCDQAESMQRELKDASTGDDDLICCKEGTCMTGAQCKGDGRLLGLTSKQQTCGDFSNCCGSPCQKALNGLVEINSFNGNVLCRVDGQCQTTTVLACKLAIHAGNGLLLAQAGGRQTCADFTECLTAEVVTPPTPPESPKCEKWTHWYNRDLPSGTGDWEDLGSLRKMDPSLCEAPAAVEAQTLSGSPAASTGEVFFKYDTTSGFVCKNSEQVDKRCLDYRVRFCCPEDVQEPPSCSDMQDAETCFAAGCPHDANKACEWATDLNACRCPDAPTPLPVCDVKSERCSALGGKCMEVCPDGYDCVDACAAGQHTATISATEQSFQLAGLAMARTEAAPPLTQYSAQCVCGIPPQAAPTPATSSCADYNGNRDLCARAKCGESSDSACVFDAKAETCGCPAPAPTPTDGGSPTPVDYCNDASLASINPLGASECEVCSSLEDPSAAPTLCCVSGQCQELARGDCMELVKTGNAKLLHVLECNDFGVCDRQCSDYASCCADPVDVPCDLDVKFEPLNTMQTMVYRNTVWMGQPFKAAEDAILGSVEYEITGHAAGTYGTMNNVDSGPVDKFPFKLIHLTGAPGPDSGSQVGSDVIVDGVAPGQQLAAADFSAQQILLKKGETYFAAFRLGAMMGQDANKGFYSITQVMKRQPDAYWSEYHQLQADMTGNSGDWVLGGQEPEQDFWFKVHLSPIAEGCNDGEPAPDATATEEPPTAGPCQDLEEVFNPELELLDTMVYKNTVWMGQPFSFETPALFKSMAYEIVGVEAGTYGSQNNVASSAADKFPFKLIHFTEANGGVQIGETVIVDGAAPGEAMAAADFSSQGITLEAGETYFVAFKLGAGMGQTANKGFYVIKQVWKGQEDSYPTEYHQNVDYSGRDGTWVLGGQDPEQDFVFTATAGTAGEHCVKIKHSLNAAPAAGPTLLVSAVCALFALLRFW